MEDSTVLQDQPTWITGTMRYHILDVTADVFLDTGVVITACPSFWNSSNHLSNFLLVYFEIFFWYVTTYFETNILVISLIVLIVIII